MPETEDPGNQDTVAPPRQKDLVVFKSFFFPQVCDEGGMGDVTIGTHYFDLRQISNEQDGDRGEREMARSQEEVLLVDGEEFLI